MRRDIAWLGWVLIIVCALSAGGCAPASDASIPAHQKTEPVTPSPSKKVPTPYPTVVAQALVLETQLLRAVTCTPTAVGKTDKSETTQRVAFLQDGSPTPLPSPSGTPRVAATATSRPTATATPLYVLLSDEERLWDYVRPTRTPWPVPTAMPPGLVGKIGFRARLIGSSTRTYVVNPDGSELAYLTVPWCYPAMLQLDCEAPRQGARVVQDRGRHGLDLFLLQADGRRDQLTFVGEGEAYDPAWSPWGDRIVFASNQQGDDDIFCVVFGDPKAPNPRTEQLTPTDDWQSEKHPSYSPDGTQVVYYSNATGLRQLWIADVGGESPPRCLEMSGECWDPVWFK